MESPQTEQNTPKKRRYVIPLVVASVILIPVIGFIVFWCLFFSDTVYTEFNDKRTQLMEEIFDFTVTDDVRLLRYEDSSQFIAIDQRLTLEVPDYESFLKNSLHVEIESREQERFDKEDHLYYHYLPSFRRTDIDISPATDGAYTIILHHYE